MGKNKKIAVVSDTVYPFNKGGKEKRFYDITTRLARQGYDITIYSMKLWQGENTIMMDGVRLHAISPYYPLYTQGRRSIKEAVLFSLCCFKLLKEDFDIAEVDHMPHLVLFPMKIVCLLKRKRMIAIWHEVWGKEYWQNYIGPVLGLIAFWVERVSVTLPDMIVSVSEHTTKKLRLVLHAKQEIVVIHSCIDVDFIKNQIPASVTSDIIYTGRLLSHKNVDALLRAVSIIKKEKPDISLIVIGDGPEKQSLESLVQKLGIGGNVRFLGFLENDSDVYKMMRSSKVFVSPSTREGFGRTVIEANACGLPVIVIDNEHNAAKELVTNGENGIVCLLNDKDIANAIEKLLAARENPQFYAKYSERYSWKNVFKNLEKIYATG